MARFKLSFVFCVYTVFVLISFIFTAEARFNLFLKKNQPPTLHRTSNTMDLVNLEPSTSAGHSYNLRTRRPNIPNPKTKNTNNLNDNKNKIFKTGSVSSLSSSTSEFNAAARELNMRSRGMIERDQSIIHRFKPSDQSVERIKKIGIGLEKTAVAVGGVAGVITIVNTLKINETGEKINETGEKIENNKKSDYVDIFTTTSTTEIPTEIISENYIPLGNDK